MEPKKNPNVDLEKKRSLYLQIGLAVALFIVLGAFEYRSYEKLASSLGEFNLAGGSTWRIFPSFITYMVLKSKLTTNNTSFYLHPYEFGAKIDPYRVISKKSNKLKVLLKSLRWNINKKAIEKILIAIAKSNVCSVNSIS